MAQSTEKEFVVKFGDEVGNGSGLVRKINDPTRRWNKEFSEQSSHPKEGGGGGGGGDIEGCREDVDDDDGELEEQSEQKEERVMEEAKKNPKLLKPISKRQDERITIERLHKLNRKTVSAMRMKRLISIVQSGVLNSLDEHLAKSADEDESSLRIRDEYEAKAAAKKIFKNVARRGSKYIHMEDLKHFMNEVDTLKIMHLFEEVIESQGISKPSLTKWVVDALKERRSLALSLDDTKTAVDELHHLLDVLVAVIIVVIWLFIFGLAVTHVLVLVSSQLLLVVFIFGNTCKTIFEAIIFLFVMHPYDVGDHCEVGGVQMIVEEMNILTTVFRRYDNQIIIYPNSILATTPYQ
ncbi:hypothetical protein F0562_026857 [Nyssa sinensis]|uniref:Mechanosensitive ion channel MscS domain-containing protein n=1 Tax=Nyssa sinensis TaxID=561372 RepID=A0A5J5B5C6_9ASTE|nr:hypothetical protein F0562_026857 [Nyssa sinensis]